MTNDRDSNRKPTPPEELLLDIESAVMGEIDSLPSPASLRTRHRLRMLGGASVLAIGLFLVFAVQNPSPDKISNQDFTESRIVLADHTSIWLTPIQTINGK